MIQWMLAIWYLIPLPFLNPAWISRCFIVHVLLKPDLENFEHYFASVCNECNYVVVWAFFGVAFLWDWNENWHFPVLWSLLSFPNLLKVQHFHSIIFRIWNRSTGLPSPPLALYIVILSKAHLTWHPGCLALGEWSQYCDYLGHEDLFCVVLQYILAVSS